MNNFEFSETSTSEINSTSLINGKTSYPFVQYDGYSRVSPLPSDLLKYNHIVGGIRVQQQTRDREDKCEALPEGIRTSFARVLTPCTGYSWSQKTLDQNELRPVETDERDKVIYLDTSAASTVPDTGRRLMELERNLWIQEDVEKIDVSMISFNREYGLWTMSTVTFVFHRGGLVNKGSTQRSQWLEIYHGANKDWMFAYDLIWIFLNIFIFVSEIGEIVGLIKYYRSFDLFIRNYILKFWNLVDWLTVFTCCMVVYWYRQALLAAEELTGYFNDDPNWQSKKGNGVAMNDDLYRLTDACLNSEYHSRWYAYAYILVALSRLFKGFSSQPRLALVTDTVTAAASDLAHFGLVFSTVFYCFALAGTLIFGRELEQFATIWNSLTTCWRIVLGDFEWQQMKNVGWLEANIFFWVFTILIVFVMINMLLAIVLETYLTVKSGTDKAETLYSQTAEIWRRFYMKRIKKDKDGKPSRLGLDYIYDCLIEDAQKKLLRIEAELEEEAQSMGIHRQHLAMQRGSSVLASLARKKSGKS